MSLLPFESTFERFHELSSRIDRSPCIHKALGDFVQQCRVHGADKVSANVRKQLAVRLAICEFQDSGVDYPNLCKKLDSDSSYHQCVQDLQGSAQWWTLYSGNFRKLRLLCLEEAAPFLQQDMVRLFFNVTQLYGDFYAEAEAVSKRARQEQRELLTLLTSLVRLAKEGVDEVSGYKDLIREESRQRAASLEAAAGQLAAIERQLAFLVSLGSQGQQVHLQNLDASRRLGGAIARSSEQLEAVENGLGSLATHNEALAEVVHGQDATIAEQQQMAQRLLWDLTENAVRNMQYFAGESAARVDVELDKVTARLHSAARGHAGVPVWWLFLVMAIVPGPRPVLLGVLCALALCQMGSLLRIYTE